MFTEQLIDMAFVLMIFATFLTQWLEKHKQRKLAIAIYWIMLAASVYCVAAGVHLATGWNDPFASVDPRDVASATHGRRGGLVVMAIRFWPYVLIGLGGCSIAIASIAIASIAIAHDRITNSSR